MRTLNEKKRECLAWMTLGAAFLVLVLLNMFYLENWIDSDMAAEMIFSRILAEEGTFLATQNWYYSTEFRVLYTQLIMEPMFYICGSWHVVRMVTNLVTYLLVLAGYFYMVRPLKLRKSNVIFTAVILLLPFSETFVTHVQMGNTYMWHMLLISFCFGMFLRLGSERFTLNWKKILLLACYLGLSVVCGLSGVRYMLALQAPLALTGLIFLMKSEEWAAVRRKPDRSNLKALFGRERLGYLVMSVLGAFAALAGYVINVAVITKRFDFQTYDATNFISVYQGIFLERLQNTFGSLLMLFGYIPDKGFLSVRGLITLIAFGFVIGSFLLAVRTGKLLRGEAGRGAQTGCGGEVGCGGENVGGAQNAELSGAAHSNRCFLLWFLVTAFILNTFVFLFTTSTIVPRYYLTVFLFAVPLLAVYYELEYYRLDRILVTGLLSGCLLLSTAKSVYSFVSTDKNADKHAAAEFLAQEDYNFGYATYWNANIMTELTNGQVEIANIDNLEDLSYFCWSSPKKYYEDDYHTGKTFLLLTREEKDEFAALPVIAEGNIVYEDEYYTVLHFDSPEEFREYRR